MRTNVVKRGKQAAHWIYPWRKKESMSKNLREYGQLANIIYMIDDKFNSIKNEDGTFRLTEKWAWEFGRKMEVVQALLSVSEFPKHYGELKKVLEDKLSQLYDTANSTFLEYKKTPIGRVT